jgi:mannose/cellobiose epimerase-like protein (N-acyl-D-glucosamine 2-epimerase family)
MCGTARRLPPAGDHGIDHRHGAWFRLPTRENVNTTDAKSPAGKVDYHTTGACDEILATLRD